MSLLYRHFFNPTKRYVIKYAWTVISSTKSVILFIKLCDTVQFNWFILMYRYAWLQRNKYFKCVFIMVIFFKYFYAGIVQSNLCWKIHNKYVFHVNIHIFVLKYLVQIQIIQNQFKISEGGKWNSHQMPCVYSSRSG